MQFKKGCSGIWIAAVVAVVDRITKAAASQAEYGRAIPLIPNVINLRNVANTGAAFSMLSNSGIFLTIFTAILVIGLTAWLIVKPDFFTQAARAGLWMIVGGGLGNLYDRIVYGHVIDFIELDFVRFAIFNAADIAVCVGAVVCAVAVLRDSRGKEPPHA